MVYLNGKPQETGADIKTVADLVKSAGVEEEGLVVLMGEKVLKRGEWESTELCEEVEIEFLNFVSGG